MKGRPSKPLSLVTGHRTNAEKEVRANAEAALLTGETMREWPSTKNNMIAHRHFVRLRKLLQAIGKNDALTESVINRYAVLLAEVAGYEKEIARIERLEEALEDNSGELDFKDYMDRAIALGKQRGNADRSIQVKRKMLLDIEKENIMTIASALRSIPKKMEEKAENPMASFLKKRAGDNAP